MISYIKQLLFLYRANKDINRITNPNFPEQALKVVRKLWQDKKHSIRRNLLASILKQYRVLHPYKPQHREEEKKYREYFTLDNHIPSFEYLLNKLSSGEEVWLRKFRNTAYYKGDRYSEYCTIGTWGDNYTIKLGKPDKKGDWIYTDPYVNGSSVDKDEFTMYLFATPAQISAKKKRLQKKKEIRDKIDNKQKEISQLYTKLSKI